MGVYIKGMEMPTSCRDCDFMNWGAVEPNRCGITDCFIGGDYDKRHDNCPLVIIPPHGRLGDLDELYEVVKKRTRNWAGGWSDIECVLTGNDIKNAPTIIPAEEGE